MNIGFAFCSRLHNASIAEFVCVHFVKVQESDAVCVERAFNLNRSSDMHSFISNIPKNIYATNQPEVHFEYA